MECTRHLLNGGFRFVLTARYSSDDVEALFSTVPQLNGSNDQTTARVALSSLQKVLVTGLLNSSKHGNTTATVGPLGTLKTLLPAKPRQANKNNTTAGPLVAELLRPYMRSLGKFPGKFFMPLPFLARYHKICYDPL